MGTVLEVWSSFNNSVACLTYIGCSPLSISGWFGRQFTGYPSCAGEYSLCSTVLVSAVDLLFFLKAFNVINGGSHAGNKLAMQEFMILPVGKSCITCQVNGWTRQTDRQTDCFIFLNLL